MLLISDVSPELIGLSELTGDGFRAPSSAVALLRRMEAGWLSFALVWTPIREACPPYETLGRRAISGLIRLPGLKVNGLAAEGADGSLAPIRLPIREVISELIRLSELVNVCFPALELSAAGFLLPR
jgi:hypothetical protein